MGDPTLSWILLGKLVFQSDPLILNFSFTARVTENRMLLSRPAAAKLALAYWTVLLKS